MYASKPDVLPGNCWAFRGSHGFVVIELASRIRPTAVTLEHIPKSISPMGKIDSAPRDFAVYGLDNDSQEEGTLLGRFTYDQDGDPLQTYQLKADHMGSFGLVELRVLSNWGHPEYTCVYRFRVHGEPVNYAGPGDVPCDFCTGREFNAVKSCLTCLASYCETHVKPHSEVTPLKRHKLINAIGDLEQKLCAEHQRVLEVLSRAVRYAPSRNSGATIQCQLRQKGQKQRSACIEIKESEKIFTELIRSIEKIHTEVIELIGANEKAAVNQAEGRMKELEQEIDELRRRNTELKQLSETEDHINFLQNFQSLCAPPEAEDLPSIIVNTDISFGAVRKAVSELKDHIEDFCKGGLVKITTTDSCQLTLDPNTVNRTLCLSEGNRKVTRRRETQPYPNHPERFDSRAHVLCREGLSGTCCYWEIDWSGVALIGVTYKGISRKGNYGSSGLGFNDKSWSLYCTDFSYSALHNYNGIEISAPCSPRIGVYLDFNAGTLSFYGVSDTMTLLYRFQTTFTEPLYPGLGLYCSDSPVTFCQLN
ncbi:UNVERIFIED_CONTAM: hypothetical protein FKN15_044585 [Acipenser sinensis]